MNRINTLKNIGCLILFLLTTVAYSQDVHKTCGTQAYKSDWLKEYQRNPGSFYKMVDSIIYVPITVHSVGQDNGFGAYAETSVLEAMCTLNNDFQESNIQFYLAETIRTLPAAQYLNHVDILTGADMMFENNVPNTINNYIVKTAAGNCGYNLPYAGIALAIDCITPEDHTWAHEVGHNLGLPHPFLGWEGGVSHDGSIAHNFSDPAPEYVTYDYTLFQDTLILDTLIIDTALVEKMDGSNCYIAGDGFCDTAPDYLAIRWQCNPSDGFSSTVQTDPDNIQFQSDGSLIMSYALDVCANKFSAEQIDAMRANLLDEKSSYLDANYTAETISDYNTELREPEEGLFVYNKEIDFTWDAVEHADFYLFRLYNVNPYFPDQPIIQMDTLVAGNSMYIDLLPANKDYVWEVAPMTDFDFCTIINSERSSFSTTLVSAVEEALIDEGLTVYPSALSAGNVINIKRKSNTSYDFKVYNASGIIQHKQMLNQDEISISTALIIKFRKQNETFIKKVLIF
jgi:hypothetical protein